MDNEAVSTCPGTSTPAATLPTSTMLPKLSAVIIAPLAALLAIPLAITASMTLSLALLALCIRLSLIYIELCTAVIANYFVIPTSSDSLLTFAPSEPATPSTASLSSTGLLASTPPTPSSTSTCRHARPLPRRHNSAISLDGRESGSHGLFSIRRSPAGTSFSSLVSGDEHRDFEDTGGWQYVNAQSRGLGLGFVPLSMSSSTSGNDAADERAWVSINKRLELPSRCRRVSLGNSHAAPAQGLAADGSGRHHKRSVTTSMLALPAARSGGGEVDVRADSRRQAQE
ncbi:hypothetical protein PHISP_00248 [Aspergillus sp. HF37]|nr:hypothetical protein PHISP_00248 [Aspergillus sp. HF37]